MKFDFATLATGIERDWPVLVDVPQDGGGTMEQEFSVRFRLVDQEELEAQGPGVKGQKAALRLVIAGLGADEEQAFTPAFLEQLLAPPYMRNALNLAYTKFAHGVAAKNASTPPA
jgi:hypothetical protein